MYIIYQKNFFLHEDENDFPLVLSEPQRVPCGRISLLASRCSTPCLVVPSFMYIQSKKLTDEYEGTCGCMQMFLDVHQS